MSRINQDGLMEQVREDIQTAINYLQERLDDYPPDEWPNRSILLSAALVDQIKQKLALVAGLTALIDNIHANTAPRTDWQIDSWGQLEMKVRTIHAMTTPKKSDKGVV